MIFVNCQTQWVCIGTFSLFLMVSSRTHTEHTEHAVTVKSWFAQKWRNTDKTERERDVKSVTQNTRTQFEWLTQKISFVSPSFLRLNCSAGTVSMNTQKRNTQTIWERVRAHSVWIVRKIMCGTFGEVSKDISF